MLEADEEAEAHRQAADAGLRLEASRGLEDDGGIELAVGESTEAEAETEYAEAALYAAELAAERDRPFPCGACGKKYGERSELQLFGSEMGCPGTHFGWCRAIDGARRRRKRSFGDDFD